MTIKLDMWVDIVCPYCYLGHLTVTEVLASNDVPDTLTVRLHSFELQPDAPAYSGTGVVEMLAHKYGISVDEATAAQRKVADMLAEAGAGFDWENAKPGSTFDAHRLIHLAHADNKDLQVADSLYRGYFEEAKDMSDKATLKELGVRGGLNASEVDAVLDGDAYAEDVRADQEMARQIGVQGVPFFVANYRHAMSGAQPAEALRELLQVAHEDSGGTESSERGA